MRIRVGVLSRVLLPVAIILGVAGQRADAGQTIKLAHAVGTQDPYQYGSEKFKEFVEKGSNGRLAVQIYPAGQLGNEREIIEGVKLGTIEVGLVASAPLAGFSNAFLLFDLPFLFNDAPHARRVLDGPIGERVAKTLEPHGIQILAYNESGFRMMFNSKRAVTTPDDLKGLKFRVMENPVYVSLFKALGSSAVPIPFGEVYGSIQTGVVDGAEIPVNVIYANKFYEQAKFMALTRHTYTPTPFIANMKFTQGLPPAERQIVTQAAKDAAAAQRALIDRRTNEFIELLKKEGVKVTDVDLAAFRAKAAPVYKEFEAKIGKDLLDAVLKTK
jgi:tripartite ATP-independent transporter DctP family solute receptor